MKTRIALLVFALTSCATMEPLTLSSKAREIKVATAITVSEADVYLELGTPSCATGSNWQLQTVQECEIDLKNQAADLGADVIVIENRSSFACGYENRSMCYQLFSRAYRKKADRSLSSSAAPLK